MRNPSRGSAGRQALVLAGGLAAWGLLAWIYVRRATPVLDVPPSAAAELPARTSFVDARLADSTQDRIVPFEPRRAVLTPEGRALLDHLVARILADTTAGVRVEGQTGLGGSLVAQPPLSQDRAHAIVTYLLDHGVPAARLTGRDSTHQVTTGAASNDRRGHAGPEFRVHPGDS